MQLGIIDTPTEESFIKAKEKGLEFLEFCININYNTDNFFSNVKNIKNWIDKYGISVGSIGRWGTDRINKNGEIIKKELQISYQLIDVASELGCKNFICGCNYVHELSYYENCTVAINFFSKLIKYAYNKNVKISTYNCRWNNFVHSDPAWTIIHGHLNNLGIKFDPSHCIYAGGDYLSEMEKWGNRFYHIHIKGSLMIDGKRYDDPPAGMDQTNWGAFMAVLYAIKYNGTLSIEPHSNTWAGKLGTNGVDFTINYIKKFIF